MSHEGVTTMRLENACCLFVREWIRASTIYSGRTVLPVPVVGCSWICRHLNILARIFVFLGVSRRRRSILRSAIFDFSVWCRRILRWCSSTPIRHTHRFVQRTLATREGNVTYTWWLQGQIVFDGMRQPGNFTGWQAKVLKMIGQNSAQAVKCVFHKYRQESYCCAVVVWWSDMLWWVYRALDSFSASSSATKGGLKGIQFSLVTVLVRGGFVPRF